MGLKVSSKALFVYSFAFVSDLENEPTQIKVTVDCDVELVKSSNYGVIVIDSFRRT